MIKLIAVAVLASLVTAACGRSTDTGGSASSTAAGTVAVPTATLIAETGGLDTPESVRFDSERGVWYISNINGNPSQKDNNGYIAVAPAADPTTVTRLVQGGGDGVTLHAPKGMALQGDTLWVADIDVLRGFHRVTGAVVAAVDFTSHNVSFLNDVAIGPDGGIYVTDSGIRFDASGNMEQTGSDRVLAVRAGEISEVAAGSMLSNPNGIVWDASAQRWIVVPFGGSDILSLPPGAAPATTIASGPGGFDGVELTADGRILVTSWADSALHVVTGSTLTKVVGGVNSPADIGYDPVNGVIAIPLFTENRVVYYLLQGG